MALTSESSDSLRLEAALSLSKYYSGIDLDSALHYVEIAEDIASALKDVNRISGVRLRKAGILLTKQELSEAETLLNENLRERTLEPQILAKTHQNLGILSIYREEYKKAIDQILVALKLFERENDSSGIAKASSNIGIINSRLKNFGEAISFFEKARVHAVNDEQVSLQVLINLAGIYYDQNIFEKAISIGNEALSIAQKMNSPIYLGSVYSNLCNSYLSVKQYDKAINSGLQGIAVKERLGQNTDILYNNLGFAYLQKKEYVAALRYLKKIPPEAPTNLRSLVYNNLGEAYSNLNDHKTAWKYAQMHKKINDSLNTIMLRERDSISTVIRTYETEKSTQAIALLNTRNELNESKIKSQRNTIWTIGLLSLLLLSLGFVIYKNQKTKQQFKEATIKHRLLRTQLNPHFLFNALNAIQARIYADKTQESISYLSNYSNLMRLVLESSDRDFITVAEDSKMLGEYIQLQKIGASAGFEHSLTVAENLDAEINLIPPVFTQPFVENAILHGLKGISNGLLEISYTATSKHLIVTIADNGLGIASETKSMNKMHRSMGTDILTERIANLMDTHKYNCTISTKSTDTGTTIILSFPLRYLKL
ncbi:histidine kinase [Maribacter sp.]|nr:histidine kinase [Maribacter sp.]